MKTVFARALVALCVTALPAAALAKPAHNHSVAKKEPKKKGQHHGHKSAPGKSTPASHKTP